MPFLPAKRCSRMSGDSRFMLRSLKVRHFRCFDAQELEFASGLNFIIGPNAHGKTSLLEAVCILLRLQSPRVARLATAIQHERRGFVVDGFYDQRHLQFYFSRERKKLALDEVVQSTAQEYLQIGRVMWFSNADIDLVRGGSDGRRRFLDFICTQRETGYRSALREYERALRSRNILLKQSSPRWREIEAFDQPLLAAGQQVMDARLRLVDELNGPAREGHLVISGSRESLHVEYRPGAGEAYAENLTAARKEDARLRQTTVGPHRDDLLFTLNGSSAEFASEGQQRTLVISLRLGAATLLSSHFATPPVLLIDDVFGELDVRRRNALLSALPPHSQRIITTTHLDWMGSSQPTIIRLGEDEG
jgi:DNA replication and repair protein RecF